MPLRCRYHRDGVLDRPRARPRRRAKIDETTSCVRQNPAFRDEMPRSPWIERRPGLQRLVCGVVLDAYRARRFPRIGRGGPRSGAARGYGGPHGGTLPDMLHSHEVVAPGAAPYSRTGSSLRPGFDATDGCTARPSSETPCGRRDRARLPERRGRRRRRGTHDLGADGDVRATVAWAARYPVRSGSAVGGVVIPRLRRQSRRAVRALRVGRRGSGRSRRRSRRIRTAGRCRVARSVRTARPARSGA